MEAKILGFLKENKEAFISGEEISRKLKVSRTAVWKHIKILKELGYEIIAQPHLGYRLNGIPDRLYPDEIISNLKTKVLGRKIFSYASTTSTNDIAYSLAEEKVSEGAMVISEKQTRGRGRLGRQWVSPEGKGIYLSLILRPKLSPAEAGKITLMSSVCVANILRREFAIDAFIKWPNDVYIANEKVAGILTELAAEQDAVKFIILGIGINLNASPGELPKGATSLSLKFGEKVDRISFLQDLLLELEHYYQKINLSKFEQIIQQWRNHSMTLGKRVKVKWRGVLVQGQAMDIDNSGALIIRDDFGFSHHILSGDIELVKKYN